MQLLRANTAVDVLIGPFLDLTDAATAEEGESPSVYLSKNGQALAAKNDATTPVHDDAGYYNCELDATDTNTEGTLVLIVEKSANALPIRHEYMVMAEAAWDSMFVAKDNGFMDVNIKTIGRSDAQETEADNLETICASSNGSALTEAGGTGDHLTAVPWNSSWDTEVQSECADALTAYDPPTKAELDTAEANIIADTEDLQTQVGTAGAGLTAVPWNANWDAEVQSEVQDAIEANNLDHLLKVADSDDVVDNSVIAKMAASDGDWSGFSAASDSLEAIRDNQTGAGAGAVAHAYTVTEDDEVTPIADVTVWVTTDEEGTNIVASGTTDDNGLVTFYLDASTTYYFWGKKAGWNFTNPDEETTAAS